MAGWLIALTGCIYAYVAYAGYAFANIGLYIAATR